MAHLSESEQEEEKQEVAINAEDNESDDESDVELLLQITFDMRQNWINIQNSALQGSSLIATIADGEGLDLENGVDEIEAELEQAKSSLIQLTNIVLGILRGGKQNIYFINNKYK